MKKLLTTIFLVFILTTQLFGQSSEENKFTFRSFLLLNSLDYSLDQNSAVGLFVGQVSGKVNENNIETAEQTFYGTVYSYAFECNFCDTL